MPEFTVKKKKEYTTCGCKIEKELLEKAKKEVLDYDLPSVNDFINEAIRFAIENLKIEK